MDIMGKVVFNIVETDYDFSKDEEKYGLTNYRRDKFINRIRCEDHVRRRSNGRFTVLEKVES